MNELGNVSISQEVVATIANFFKMYLQVVVKE